MTAQSTSLHSAFLPADGDTSPHLHKVAVVTDRVQRPRHAAVTTCPSHDEATAVMKRSHRAAVTKHPSRHEVTVVMDRVQRSHRAAVTICVPRRAVAVVMDRVQRDHSTAVTRYRPHRRVTPMPPSQVHRRLAPHSMQQPGAAQPNISATSPEAVPE